VIECVRMRLYVILGANRWEGTARIFVRTSVMEVLEFEAEPVSISNVRICHKVKEIVSMWIRFLNRTRIQATPCSTCFSPTRTC
jgi:hypothetical protein